MPLKSVRHSKHNILTTITGSGAADTAPLNPLIRSTWVNFSILAIKWQKQAIHGVLCHQDSSNEPRKINA